MQSIATLIFVGIPFLFGEMLLWAILLVELNTSAYFQSLFAAYVLKETLWTSPGKWLNRDISLVLNL